MVLLFSSAQCAPLSLGDTIHSALRWRRTRKIVTVNYIVIGWLESIVLQSKQALWWCDIENIWAHGLASFMYDWLLLLNDQYGLCSFWCFPKARVFVASRPLFFNHTWSIWIEEGGPSDRSKNAIVRYLQGALLKPTASKSPLAADWKSSLDLVDRKLSIKLGSRS